jgi:hypothetical protein
MLPVIDSILDDNVFDDAELESLAIAQFPIIRSRDPVIDAQTIAEKNYHKEVALSALNRVIARIDTQTSSGAIDDQLGVSSDEVAFYRLQFMQCIERINNIGASIIN